MFTSLNVVGIALKPDERIAAFLVLDGAERVFYGWNSRHTSNGSLIYRKVTIRNVRQRIRAYSVGECSKYRTMFFPVHLVIDIRSNNPEWLDKQMHELVMPTVEAGLYEHKMSLQTHTQHVEDAVERMMNVTSLSVELPIDGFDLKIVWILLGIMLALAAIVWAIEMLVGYSFRFNDSSSKIVWTREFEHLTWGFNICFHNQKILIANKCYMLVFNGFELCEK